MKPISKKVLMGVIEEMPSFSWGAAELDELTRPKFGIITGFQNLLDDIEHLRELDLGATGPAGMVRGKRST